MKPDYAHKQTDKELAALEKRISAEYGKAAKELQDKIDDYFAKFEKRDAELKKQLDAGEITEEYYKQWRLAQIGRGKRFEALRDRIAERMTKANETAAAYINDATPGLYSLNRNYAAYTIEQVAGDVGFDLWDEQTVKRLIKEQPDLMPYYPPERAVKRGIDLKWGKQQITAQVTSGILQGESIKHLADRLNNNIPDMNRTSAIRAARTAVTGAQNAGRQDSYHAAKEMGIKLKKRWLATLDGRTRHEHAVLDGQTVDEDKPFKVDGYELMYPGDPSGPAHLIYNCRCTVIADVDGVDTSDAKRWARDPGTGRNVLIEDMTYSEWAGWNIKKCGGLSADTYLVPAKAKDEIEKLKESLTYEKAEALVGAQQGLFYRGYARESGMSDWGHAMFADYPSPWIVHERIGGKQDGYYFTVSPDVLTDIDDLRDEISKARKRSMKRGELEDYAYLSDDDFFDLFNPKDIVDSAVAYDDYELTTWLNENVLMKKHIGGVRTADGAVVYDDSLLVRNLPLEVYTAGEETEDIEEVIEVVEKAKETVESAAMSEYLAFKLEMETKYTVDAMWRDMTDAELAKLDNLERIAYKGK